MADEFHLGSGNWWDTSRNRFDSGTSTQPAASISTTLNSIASLGWPTEMVDMKSTAASGGGSLAALHGGGHDQSSGGVLGLSSQGMDWNVQALLRGEKGGASPEDNDFKQINQGFSIDQPHFSSNDSSSTYGLLLLDQNQQQNNSYPYPYGVNTAEILPSWNKFPQLLRQSPPPLPFAGSGSSHLHFTNATPFWNPTAAVADARSSFPPPSQLQIPLAPSFDEKPKNTSEMRNLSTTTKKNSTETSNKRTRSETPSPMPAFKVRKEKMGDRITALQQLVSPFGKTDTASVLSEAIEYIKFLHEQVGALSAPYMKNGAPIQHQQNYEKSRDPEEEHHRQDLRSRGLCLVPVSSTFPVTNETTVDFWTPTFGGSFR